jgi:preprotein translocase subunit YajC
MKKHFLNYAFAALASATLAGGAFGQTPATQPATSAAGGQSNPAISPNRVLGDVTAIDPAALSITLKVDGAGAPVNVVLNTTTVYYRVNSDALARAAKGAITPADMTKITLAGVAVGNRLVVLGKISDDRKTVPARVVIVATKEDIAQKQERDRAEWQRRGILGTVTAVNPAAKEITVNVSTPEGVKPLVVDAAGERVLFRRYAPDSVKFADAKSSSFAEVKTGDRLRALGERSTDGARFTPEEIVSGSFRQLVGTVTAVDAATGEIKIKTQDNKALTILVNSDSNLRRLPPMMAQFMAQRAAGGAGGRPGGRPGGGGGGGGAPGEGARPPQAAAAGGAPGAEGGRGEGGRGGGRRMGGGGFDPQEMLERMPQTTLAELKAGDMIVVSSTSGADPTRLTAIALVAGIDAIINAMPAGAARPNVGGGQDLGLPGGIDLGIGLP